MEADRAGTNLLGFRLFLAADGLAFASLVFALINSAGRAAVDAPRLNDAGLAASGTLLASAFLWRAGHRASGCLGFVASSVVVGYAWMLVDHRSGVGAYPTSPLVLGAWLLAHLFATSVALLRRVRAAGTPLLDELVLFVPIASALAHITLRALR